MVRVDCLLFKGPQKEEAAHAIAEIRGFTLEQAIEEMDRAGRRRFILAKELTEEVAKGYADRLNAIHPDCADVTKPRLG
jgi:hypothetical protein